MRCAVIGAGMAGLACADSLQTGGHEVTLFDKGRGPGGRMSTRRMEGTPLGTISFDHGAPYFTARGEAFKQMVTTWEATGVAARWPAAGLDAWVGTPGMNAPVRAMAARHDVRWATMVSGLVRSDCVWSVLHGQGADGPYDAVAIAIPVEQATPLLSLHDFQMARAAIKIMSRPCWTGMFAFAEPLVGAADFVRNSGHLSWAARNGAKPGRDAVEAWVVQANALWSADHLEDSAETVTAALLDALSEVLQVAVPEPIAAAAHRWRFAMPSGNVQTMLWNEALQLGACGDWLLDGYVELAWLSGHALGERIAGQGADALSGTAGSIYTSP